MIRAVLFGLLGGIAAASPQQPSSELLLSKWKLVELNRGRIRVPSNPSFTMTLEQGHFQLSGCNLVSGKLEEKGTKLFFSGPASTQKACPGELGRADAAFARLVGGSLTVHLSADQLRIVGDAGSFEWLFQREPMASSRAKTKFVYVAAFTKDCTGVIPMKCLQVRESKDRPWTLYYSGIVGFEHVPGIEYRLRIKEDQVSKPLADAPSVIWYLDTVIEQTVVDRQAADAYLSSKKN